MSKKSVEKNLKEIEKRMVCEKSVEEKGVKEVERSVSVENEILKVCVRKEAAVVCSKRERWNGLIVGVTESGERMERL